MPKDHSTAQLAEPAALSRADYRADPHAVLARHRAHGWWARLPELGVTQILKHGAARDLLGRSDDLAAYLDAFILGLLENNPAVGPDLIRETRRWVEGGILDLDGADHHDIRSLLGRAFTPRSTAALRPYLENEADRLVSELAPGDDIMQGIARELPGLALCELTGIPDQDREIFMDWVDIIEAVLSSVAAMTMDRQQSDHIAAAMVEMDDYARALILRRRDEPVDDVISRIATDPADIDDEARALLLRALLFAGNDTTRNMLGMALLVLAEHPITWERLATDPDHTAPVVDELLRLTGSVPAVVRQVRHPFTYRDRAFEPGEVLLISLWSASRDEEMWGDDSGRFDPNRTAATCSHLAFGHGIHYCIGASLAREELTIALRVLARQITDLEVIGDPVLRLPTGIYGPISLRLNFRRRDATVA